MEKDNKHSHYGHRARLRDRVYKEGLNNFQDYQVLEYALSFVIPYKDTNPIAHALVNKFGSLAGVLEASVEDLQTISGLGEVSAYYLASFIQIFTFYERERENKTRILINAPDTYEFVKECFKNSLNEEVYLISLNEKNKVIKVEKIGEGDITNVKVSFRKITDAISRNRVSKIILAHNHPNSDAKPSDDDDQYTKALVTTLALNDCVLVDHMIIGSEDGDYFSYQRSGKIDEYVKQVERIIKNNIYIPPLKYDYLEIMGGREDD